MKELPIEAAGNATENPWQPLRHPLVRIVQVTALFAAAAMLGMVTVSPTTGALAFSKDGRKLLGTVNGYGWPMPYGVISVWEASTGKRLAHFNGAGGWCREIAVSPDGSTLAAANDSPVIGLWDLKRGTKIGTLTGHRGVVWWVGFDPTSGTLASTSVDGEVRLWDVANKRSKIAFRVDEYGAQDVRFSPDGTTLATAHREGIRFWSSADGHLQAAGLAGETRSLAFARDGKSLAGADDRGRVCVWDASTGRLRARFSAVDPLRRWGPLAAAVLVSMTATIFLRYAKSGPGKGDSPVGGD